MSPVSPVPAAQISVDSFTIALWLYSQGHRPLSAGINPSTGRTKFIFPGEAESAYASYNAAKDALNRMAFGQPTGAGR